MLREQANNNFYISLLEFLMSAKQRMVTIGNEFGLSSIQAATLLLLDESKPRPMKNFCMLYRCDASNVTGIIDGLEKKGLVSRQSSPKDRRVKVIQLEAAGKKMQQALLVQLNTDRSFLFGPLTADEAEQFMRIIKKLATATVPGQCDAGA
jgi:DNA-binding MarR family transcriptional regulator